MFWCCLFLKQHRTSQCAESLWFCMNGVSPRKDLLPLLLLLFCHIWNCTITGVLLLVYSSTVTIIIFYCFSCSDKHQQKLDLFQSQAWFLPQSFCFFFFFFSCSITIIIQIVSSPYLAHGLVRQSPHVLIIHKQVIFNCSGDNLFISDFMPW